MEKEENEFLERKIEELKKNLADYLSVVPFLDVSKKEKERVINQFLDDILERQKKLNNKSN